MNGPAASIIIITYNSARHIEECLAAVRALDYEPAPQVIVLDNASQDGTPELVQSCAPWAQLLRSTENWGFGGGANRAAAAATGSLLAFLNPDAAPHPGWLAALADALQERYTGVVGSKVLMADGRTIQSVGSLIDEELYLPAYRGEGEPDRGQYDRQVDLASIHGAGMALRREVWDALGGFDESYYPLYLEETDLCRRARAAGWRVVIEPAAVVQHYEAASTGKGSAQFFYYFQRSRLRYVAKWASWQELWECYRPAEARRLRETDPLDRLICKLVYAEGIPLAAAPDAPERTRILAAGARLAGANLPLNAEFVLSPLVQAALTEAVLEEPIFRPTLFGRLRGLLAGLATRWYVVPIIHRQTRVNLALGRALNTLGRELAAQSAEDALAQALLAFRLRQLE